MTIICDSHYTIGRTHWYCQDYALQGMEPYPHVIMADGCSASPNSDIGARLLVLSACQNLAHFMRSGEDEDRRLVLHWRLGRRIVRRAARQARMLGLDAEVLDATLLIAWCDQQAVHVHLYGDGCIVAQQAGGELMAIQVEYADNAPYYLSYLLDAERHALYQEAAGQEGIAQTISCLYETANTATRHESFDNPLIFFFPLAIYPTVAVATDGLASLVNLQAQQRIALLAAGRAVLEHNSSATTVRESLEKALATLSEQSIINIDDISIGIFTQHAEAD